MEYIWFVEKIYHGRRNAWVLAAVNEKGLIVDRLVTIQRFRGKWHWVTKPPLLRRGSAHTHDEARAQAEQAIGDQNAQPVSAHNSFV